MNYTKQITMILAGAAMAANREKEVEDAAHIYRTTVFEHAKAQVRSVAIDHVRNAQFDGKKYDSKNPAIALEWSHFLSTSEAVELRDFYDSVFDSYAPTIWECNKCEKSYTGKSCPTCENRRFEADHSNL